MSLFGKKTPSTDALLEQAAVHHEHQRIDLAKAIYQNILQTEADHIVALNELGRILLLERQYDQAISIFRRVIAREPDLPIPHKNLGAALCVAGFLEESFAEYHRYATLLNSSAEGAISLRDDRIPPYKILHDQEQCEYLFGKGDSNAECHRFIIQNAERLDGPAVNPNFAAKDVLDSWQNNNPKILVVDDFLTNEALQSLRQFCWGSTIWRRVYENGYLGASAEHGLGSPLLAQIIEELSKSLQPMIGGLPLLQFWAFKYDSSLQGVNLHADFATVNINFWITPDDANLDPEGGGLIVWDKPAPLEWDFKQYNQNEEVGRAFLVEAGARPVTIPHRSNRAVIFDSSLFHETDKINFKKGYLNRRINLTLLFGRREDIAGKP